MAAAMVTAACSSDDGGDAATATTAASTTTVPLPDLAGDPFTLGVASGDPLDDAVVIWTRLAVVPDAPDGEMPAEPVPVRWELSADERFTDVVAEGMATATPEYGHSVHVDVTGLPAATTHWYRFTVGGYESTIGRARTLPAAQDSPGGLRFAVANCQAWQTAHPTPYDHMAEEDLDLVFFVGDYIYELANPPYIRGQGLDPPRTVDEYRAMYGRNHAEPQLQAAHAAHTWVLTWDDHEVEDNYAGLEPGSIGRNLDPDADANFPAKRAAAYQAWWENVPVRPGPPDPGGGMAIHREVAFGDLATFAVIDNRQYRDPIAGTPEDALPRPLGGGPQVAEALDEARTMLGAEQEAWLEDLLRSSATPWNVLVQQTLMAEIDRRPDLDDAGYTLDAWDGYVANRNRILGLVADEGVPGFVVVGGDIHSAVVADLKADYKDPRSPVVGAEFVAPSISATELIQPEALAGSRANEHIHYYEPGRRGYLRCTVTRDGLEAQFRFVTSTAEPSAAIEDGPRWRVTAGEPAATGAT
jgi:alkaline phosphatase D